MKFSAVTIAFNEEKLIRGVIKCLQPFVEKHIVLLQDKDYYGNGKPDRTGDISVSVYCKNESLHHLSWCEPKDILKKVLSYGHAKLFDGKLWYEQNYKDWKLGDPVMLPSFSHIFNKFEAVYQPLPKELHDKLL